MRKRPAMIPTPPPIFSVHLSDMDFPDRVSVGTTIHICRIELKDTERWGESITDVGEILQMCDTTDALISLHLLADRLFGQSTHRTFVRLERDEIRQEVRVFAIRPPLKGKQPRGNG